MLRLLLLRHAKSDWTNPGLSDIDRPLNARGRAAAPLMGAHMASHQLQPDRILCSVARRTRETLALLLPHLASDVDIRITRDLYGEAEDDYIDTIRAPGRAARKLLVIGHNPGLQATALELIGNGNPALKEEIERKFPTAALAVVDFPHHRWSEIGPRTGRVVAFFQPKLLEEETVAEPNAAGSGC